MPISAIMYRDIQIPQNPPGEDVKRKAHETIRENDVQVELVRNLHKNDAKREIYSIQTHVSPVVLHQSAFPKGKRSMRPQLL